MLREIKLAVCGLVVAIASAFLAPAAQAAPTKLPTSFNESQHVYVLPGAKVDIPRDFEKMLVSEASQQNMKVYVVYTLEGDEALANQFADQCLTKLLQMWSVQQNFPADNYLI